MIIKSKSTNGRTMKLKAQFLLKFSPLPFGQVDKRVNKLFVL
jgi:hypothetical protein